MDGPDCVFCDCEIECDLEGTEEQANDDSVNSLPYSKVYLLEGEAFQELNIDGRFRG